MDNDSQATNSDEIKPDKVMLIDRIRRNRIRHPHRRRRLRSTSVLPALMTLGNALAGFAAIHYATKDALGEGQLSNLAIASWLIVAAMICDTLDGRLARMTRQTSDFGGQLDSLSDIISFGVAPAVLILRLSVTGLRIMEIPAHGLAVERLVWCIAGVYVACAALRLARFNVENEPDESAHMEFRGLPSPAATVPIIAMVLLTKHLADKGWLGLELVMQIASVALPVVTIVMAMLMISRFRYPHLINQYIRGKKPFGYLVKLLVVALAVLLQPFITAVVLSLAFALSGPILAFRRKTSEKQGLVVGGS